MVKFDILQTNSPEDHHFAVLRSVLGSGSGFVPDSKGNSGSGSRKAKKLSPQKRRKTKKFFMGLRLLLEPECPL
jgi:hypothetical protein